MREIYILYECDEQKWPDSMKVIAATTDREALFEQIGNKIRSTEMHYGGKTALPGYEEFEKDRQNNRIDFDRLDYGFVEAKENIQTANNNRQLSGEYIEAAVTKEFIKRLTSEGYHFIQGDDHSPDKIFKDVHEVLMFDEENNMLYKPEYRDEAYELMQLKKEAREYVTAYMEAQASGAEKNQDYYILMGLNGRVLATRQSQNESYSFVTWQMPPDRRGYEIGHYFTDFTAAKEDFARRAGLINENKLFTETELKIIRSNLSDFLSLDSGTYLDMDRESAIKDVISKIDDIIVPEIAERQEEHGEDYEREL